MLEDLERILTPTLVLYEVYKTLKRDKSEEHADVAVSQLAKTRTVPLDDSIALLAADLSLRCKLSMADAIIYATAQAHGAKLVTLDPDFRGLPGVELLRDKS